MGGVEYQVTKVDPTDPETKGMVYQVHKVSEEVAATLGGKVYRARIIKDPTEPTVAGKVYQIVLIDDPEDPAVKGKVYNAILTGGSEAVVVGPAVSPLALDDAVAGSLSYVKAFGGTEQRNIPQPYTQVNYVTNTAQTTVNTGIMIDFAKNYEFEVECRATTGSWYILQSRASSSGNITGISGANSGSTITLVVGNVTACTSAITRTVGHKLYVKATLNAGTATLYVKDETANTEDTKTGSYGTTQPNPTAAMYLFGNAGGQYVGINSDIYMARIKENDTVVMDYVPARQVAAAGFYDTVSGTFKTGFTPANLSADDNTVPTPDAPMDIVSNNGVLKYGNVSKNLFDEVYPEPTAAIKYMHLYLGPGTYTCSYSMPVHSSNASMVYFLKGNVNTGANNGNNQVDANTPRTVTSTNGYVTIAYRTGGGFGFTGAVPSDYNCMIESGSPATAYEPYKLDVYADGTVETINVHTRNLFNGVFNDGWGISSANGEITSSAGRKSFYIPVKAGQKYTISRSAVGESSYWYYGTYQNEPYAAGQSCVSFGNMGSSAITYTITIPNGANYLVIFFGTGISPNVQAEIGTTATDYVPYYDGGTATAEMLLKVGNYTDVQEILSGAVTRNIGIKVLDGTEDWTWNSSSAWRARLNISTVETATSSTPALLCNMFTAFSWSGVSATTPLISINSNGTTINFTVGWNANITTLSDWTQWLATQYAIGTPVIVVYPLATPTTESVAGQTLQVTDGDNIVEITQASIDDLELEAEYEKEAE